MSDTYHHGRPQKHKNSCGTDLWSRRPLSGCPKTASFKRMSRRLERARRRRVIRDELRLEEMV